jgi:hypothetical protein
MRRYKKFYYQLPDVEMPVPLPDGPISFQALLHSLYVSLPFTIRAGAV